MANILIVVLHTAPEERVVNFDQPPMSENHTIAAVVPAYNEKRLIGCVIETMPKSRCHILVADGCSEDATVDQEGMGPNRGQKQIGQKQ